MGRNKSKTEQASKVLMWMPTLCHLGKAAPTGKQSTRVTCLIRRASGHGTLKRWYVITGRDPSRDEGGDLNDGQLAHNRENAGDEKKLARRG